MVALRAPSIARIVTAVFGLWMAVALFGAFIIIDDIFLAYQIEASHRMIFILFCAGYLVVRNTGT